MVRFSQTIVRCAASSVFLFFNLGPAAAGDHFRREPKLSHGFGHSSRYTRETTHGLIYYPCATYWASGDAVDHWDAGGSPSYSSYGITPSPWAFRTIAPYAHQYRSFSGTGFCVSECLDCRN